jgi:hypothetical protein
MKLVKNMVFAGLLVFTLALNTLAGDQQTPNATQPPPPDKVVAYEEGTAPSGDPYTGEITAETTDYLFFEALAALLSVY